MTACTYTGKLTDFGRTPFPGAVPRLYVKPERPGYGAAGLLADKRIPVTVTGTPGGRFSWLVKAERAGADFVIEEPIYGPLRKERNGA